MSRAQSIVIEQLESTVAGLREQVSGLRGEIAGQLRGEARVGAQLADDISQASVRAESYRQASVRAVADVRRLLRIVAEYVVDQREAGGESVERLVDVVALAGFPLPTALVAAERADAAARADAHMSAAAVASAPVPHRASA